MTTKTKTALSLAGLILAIMMYLGASHAEYKEETYFNIPDTTLQVIYERLDDANQAYTRDNVIGEYKLIKSEQR